MKAMADNTVETYRTGSALRISSSSAKANPIQTPQIRARGKAMRCSICTDLERAFERRSDEHSKALSAICSRFSSGITAYTNVEMERARSDLDVHRSVCLSVSGVAEAPGAPVLALRI
jgi:tRNA U54 and U55 pseudouridine synthase Pus10